METTTEQEGISALAKLRAKLGQKAKLEPNFRFYTLYNHISREDVLLEAWKCVKRNGGAAGIDRISIKSIAQSPEGVTRFLEEIRGELRSNTYYPKPVKRVFIPKSDGKLRPLGIPTVKDRVVQAALLMIIEPIFEQDFLDCSYGFRPERSAHQAIDAINLATKKGQLQIYDADLKSYFDTIPHDKLMKALERRIADRHVLKLISKWLKAPIWEPGKPMKANDKGTPQGGIISPLLANLYMHWFDKVFHGPNGPGTTAKATLVRYADDFVVMAKYMTEKIKRWIEETLERRFDLTINKEKTKVVNLSEPKSKLDFLGFSMRMVKSKFGQGQYCVITPSEKSLKKARDKIKEHTGSQNSHKTIREQIACLNLFLKGWGQYFSKGYPGQAFNDINGYTQERIYRSLQRRSQRGYRKRDDTTGWYQYIKSLGIIRITKERFRMNAPGRCYNYRKAGCGKAACPV